NEYFSFNQNNTTANNRYKLKVNCTKLDCRKYDFSNSCAIKDSTNCNKIIQFLVDQFPEFKDCICIKDNCSIRMWLGKKCSSDKGNCRNFIWRKTTYHHECQSNIECVNDEVCNKQLSLYLQVCQINGSSCDINRCRAALHAFYTNMPFQVAQMLTFCDCMQSDDNCHQSRQFLHGHPCAIQMVPTPSCVHVMQLCRENKLCWSKYKAFTSKCLKHVSQDCLEENSCLKTWNAIDPICSESVDCRAAYVDLWGSVLRVKCTCEAASQAEKSVCQWFHRILHGKDCLRKYTQALVPHKIRVPANGFQFQHFQHLRSVLENPTDVVYF
uniref:GDNF family receptor alpha like n=1 Tax=Pseudonaja textilis TaxID=8673 RepID=A0A670YL90_PSETE